MTHARTTYLVILGGTLLWCAGILLAPACGSGGGASAELGEALFTFYHPICHQLPERSIPLFGSTLGVCVRCSAIYFAFLAGLLLYPFFRHLRTPAVPGRWIVPAAALPMLVDAFWPGLLFYTVTNFTRAATGAAFGIVLPFVVVPIAIQAIHEIASTTPILRKIEKGISDA